MKNIFPNKENYDSMIIILITIIAIMYLYLILFSLVFILFIFVLPAVYFIRGRTNWKP